MRDFPPLNYIMDQKLFLLTVVVEKGLVTNTGSIVKVLRHTTLCCLMENHNGTATFIKLQKTNDSSADPKQIGWRLLAEESWLRNLC